MVLEAGQRLSHYRLTEKIGEGGMGVVWKAEDTTLDREVAIKVLTEAFTTDADRLARFQREAKLLASLNHPNIAGIFGAHEHEAVRFLALEFVAGEDLSERLARGPLPIDDVLSIARQIAEALEVAHDNGIVHRDLKPANVKVTDDLRVKVLDFGLAKVDGPQSAATGDPAHSPTVTSGGTRAGVILGTAPYMSPEQARAKPVDKRTDLWALGCLLYECLAGRKPFDGDSTTDVLAQIVTRQPDFDALPRTTPGFLVRLLHRCLEKDPRRRLRDAGEVRVAIEAFQADPDAGDAGAASIASVRPRRSVTAAFPWVLVGVLGALLVYVLIGRTPSSDQAALVSGWSIGLPPANRVALPSPGGGFDYSRTVAISRDGSLVAFCVQGEEDRSELFLKSGSPEPHALPGTANARGPFFSPDGAWLGYYGNDDNSLYKVALAGGAPQKLSVIERTLSFDATWAPDGDTIVFATDDGLWRVSAEGGPIEQLTAPDGQRGEVGHHFPRFTADGRSVLFTVSATLDTHLAVLELATGSWETIISNASLGVPVGTDRIVVARSGELLAAHYDPGDHRITGSLIPVEQGIETSPGLGGVVLTQFDLSDTGTLVYVPVVVHEPPDQLFWVDQSGNETLITEGPGTWVHPRLSPDGSIVSLDIHSGDGMRDIHLYEFARGQLRQLTRTGMTWESEWRPDGKRLAIMSAAPAGQWSLFWIPVDFSRPAELLFQSKQAIPASWLPDGTSLLFSEWVDGGIWRLSTEGDRKPELVMHTQAQEGFPRLSPDGEWIAFVETESGRREIFVQSFPELGAKHQVSIDGGGEAVWSRDGRRLFFRNSDRMFAVDVDYEPTIRFSRPKLLFVGNYDSAEVGHQHYDISIDNERFLMIKHGVPDGPHEVRVVLNWSQALESQ